MSKQDIIMQLQNAVIVGDKNSAVLGAKSVINEGIPILEAIDGGLVQGMNIIGDRYARHEVFFPQILLAADALYGALNILLPNISLEESQKRSTVVLGVVEGDVHDIGKNIVKAMLISAGYTVKDLGRDVAPTTFVSVAKEEQAAILALSTLMTPTMEGMKQVIDDLVESGLRNKVKVIIGGVPTSKEFAEDIGADFHGLNAQDAVIKLKGAF
jgi:corrinoid protein of di/trimethylamine methyltransferase